MDIQPTNQQPISDDQELAKVLAGVTQQADEAVSTPPADDAITTPPPAAEPEVPAAPVAPIEPEEPIVPEPAVSTAPISVGNGNLDSIKTEALGELRPLVDKLNVAPEEKFDTYLLLIRSTDDQSLIAPAHEAARSITDEARRAQALLDIIKEIDYLSNPQHAQQ
jgi:hypothetical protein